MKARRAEKNTYRLPTGDPLRRELVRAFRTQRKAVLHWIETGETKPGDYKSLINLSRKTLWDLQDLPGWDDFRLGALKMSERMVPELRLIWDKAAMRFAPKVGLDPNEWSVVDRNTQRMIEAAALAFCKSTLDTTSLAIEDALQKTREALAAGVVDRGESVEKLTKRINAIFADAETWRARRIAQTETSRAVHAAQEATAYQSGVVAGWEWLLSDDACPLCKTIAARAPRVRLGQAFAVVSDDPNYGTIKFPPLHPHCNCTVMEILDVDAAGVAWSRPLGPSEVNDERQAA